MGDSKTKIEAVNANMDGEEADTILVASDDMWPEIDGYDDVIISGMETIWPNKDGSICFNDGLRKDGLMSIAVMGWNLYKDLGYIYHPDYISLYADNEQTEHFSSMGKLVRTNQIIIRHKWVPRGQHDDLHDRNEDPQWYKVDGTTFIERRNRGFPKESVVKEINDYGVTARIKKFNDSKKKRIVVIVLANDEYGYDKMVQACRNTWAKPENIPDNIIVVYNYGHRSGVQIDQNTSFLLNDCLYTDAVENRTNLMRKTIMAFNWFDNQDLIDFDYVFRTNCGSYIQLDKLSDFVENKPTEKFYSGINNFEYNIKYASGAGFFLSRDLIKLICEHPTDINYDGRTGKLDDVSIGDFLVEKNGIKLDDSSERQDLSFVHNNSINTDFSPDCYHYYFRHTMDPNCHYNIHEKLQGILA